MTSEKKQLERTFDVFLNSVRAMEAVLDANRRERGRRAKTGSIDPTDDQETTLEEDAIREISFNTRRIVRSAAVYVSAIVGRGRVRSSGGIRDIARILRSAASEIDAIADDLDAAESRLDP